MPTRRMIEPSFWQSESMGRLTIRQRLMFIGMFSNADDQGRLRASAPIVRASILPFDDVSLSDIEADILAIEREKCIKLYTVNDARYAQVLNWWTYQTPQWAYPSLIPKPDGWSDRLRFRQSNEVITENWSRGKIEQDSIDQDSIEKGKAKRKALGKGLGKDESADKPRRTSKSETPLQIAAYREVAHRFPNKSLYADIISAVPESDIEFYKQVVKAWIGLGWNPSNIAGQLEAYKRREIPHKNGSTGGYQAQPEPRKPSVVYQ